MTDIIDKPRATAAEIKTVIDAVVLDTMNIISAKARELSLNNPQEFWVFTTRIANILYVKAHRDSMLKSLAQMRELGDQS